MDTNRESAIKAALQKVVDDGQLAGAATLVWRSGKEYVRVAVRC